MSDQTPRDETPRFFNYAPDPDNPGWYHWDMVDERRFNTQGIGRMLLRKDDDAYARLRMFPGIRHANLMDKMHGGAMLAFIDIALFACARALGSKGAVASVTLDLSTQFLAMGELDQPMDAVVELLRETGRLIFLRGILEQGESRVAAFSGTLRKAG
ncbi:MAG: PaaI family thioesterase [Alphaproteobacteria bacterium]|nr:PaaI family thioesterase [Alphaproteobacteria bacterium]MDE2041846.1 PaaI family thioesterase [Alphaproteobacteria bacterium]MDE2340330.1 PaaI family thioesterase [Alphaproteobacteria bacterium]